MVASHNDIDPIATDEAWLGYSPRGLLESRRPRSTWSCLMPGDRHRRRIMLKGERGTEFLLDLDEAVALRDGDGIMLDDGGIVLVTGQAEPLAELKARTPLALMQLAWHLGNRHTDVQIVGDRLRIRRDHVLEQMVAGLGASGDRGRCAVRSGAGLRRMTMSIGMSKIMAADDAQRRRAVPADGVAVAVLSGRRVLLFERDRMGGRGRRHQGRGKPAALARGGDRRGRRLLRRGVLRPCPSVIGRLRRHARCARWPSLPRRFAPSKERHLETTAQGAAFIEATRAAWSCARSIGWPRPGLGQWPIRSQSA